MNAAALEKDCAHRGASASKASAAMVVGEIIPLNILYRALFLMAILGALATGASSRAAKQASAPNQKVQVIDMTAKRYSFNPSPVHVKVGTKVELRITAIDHDHGFKINVYPAGADTNTKGAPGLLFTSFQNCFRLPKGKVTTIEFVAEKPGSYPFKCCVFCGLGHMGMKGELVVDP